MKSWFSLVLIGLLAGLLTACSESPSSSGPPPANPPAEAKTNAPAAPTTNAAAAPATPTATATTPKENPAVNNANTNEVAVIKTTQGEMVIEFWPDVAPKTVENFKKLAKQGFYDGTAFHRIIKGFMIQGGDPLSKTDSPDAGTGGPGYQIKAEFSERKHERGVLSMARSQNPDSAGSQFFVCLGDASFLDRKYTCFGRVTKGDDVLGRLGDTPVGPNGSGENSRPLQRAGVESIKIVPADSVK